MLARYGDITLKVPTVYGIASISIMESSLGNPKDIFISIKTDNNIIKSLAKTLSEGISTLLEHYSLDEILKNLSDSETQTTNKNRFKEYTLAGAILIALQKYNRSILKREVINGYKGPRFNIQYRDTTKT